MVEVPDRSLPLDLGASEKKYTKFWHAGRAKYTS